MRQQGFTADIPAELKDADELLRQYGQWARDRLKIHRCGSAEGRYRPPPDESVDEDARRDPKEVVMSTPDALRVARALIRVPEQERIVLQILYVPQRIPAYRQLKSRHIPDRMSRERHLHGLRMFANILRSSL